MATPPSVRWQRINSNCSPNMKKYPSIRVGPKLELRYRWPATHSTTVNALCPSNRECSTTYVELQNTTKQSAANHTYQYSRELLSALLLVTNTNLPARPIPNKFKARLSAQSPFVTAGIPKDHTIRNAAMIYRAGFSPIIIGSVCRSDAWSPSRSRKSWIATVVAMDTNSTTAESISETEYCNSWPPATLIHPNNRLVNPRAFSMSRVIHSPWDPPRSL